MYQGLALFCFRLKAHKRFLALQRGNPIITARLSTLAKLLGNIFFHDRKYGKIGKKDS